jgi:hypothetical protein
VAKRALTDRYSEISEKMFDIAKEKLTAIIDFGLKYDQSYAIGILSQLESYINEHKESAYKVILSITESLFSKITNVYEKFVVSLHARLL